MPPDAAFSSAVSPLPDDRLRSLAIAGAWGYIGRKFLDAGIELGLRPQVFDPGAVPEKVPPECFERYTDEEAFYRLPADLFHLALLPEARNRALAALLHRGRTETIAILNEKPMAAPEHPEHCRALIDAVDASNALMLFDFLELYSPLTEAVVDHLSRFRQVKIHSIEMLRMKDREDPANPRNYKVMTPIQFQESVHCLAWVLYLFARLKGGLEESLSGGVSVQAEAKPYAAPNPQDYPYVVDGQCVWQMDWDGTRIDGRTDFKRNAPWTKRRILRGQADGKPVEIEAEFQEGRKRLLINGVDQRVDPQANSYVDVLNTFARWRHDVNREQLLRGVYPNPRFARLTYQLSSALWRASYNRRGLQFDSHQALLDFDAKYADEVPNFASCREPQP